MLHKKLMGLHSALGYHPSPDGVCVVYVEKGIDAWLLGPEEFKHFEIRNKVIKKHGEKMPAHLQRAKDKLKNPPLVKLDDKKNPSEKKLTKDELFVFEVAAYMDEGELYFRLHHHALAFNQPLDQLALQKISQFAQPKLMDDIKQGGGRHHLLATVSLYNEKELIIYLTCLNDFAKKAKENFAISLGSDNHIIGLGYDVQKQSWQLIDVSNPDCKPISADAQNVPVLADTIRKSFLDQLLSSSSFIEKLLGARAPLITGFSANFFCRESQAETMRKFVDELKAYGQFKALHMLTPSQAVRSNQRGATLAWFLALEGDAKALQSLLLFKDADGRPLANLNRADSRGFTPLLLATNYGHVAAVQVLVDAVDTNDSPSVDLNKAATNGMTPAIMCIF